MKRECCIDDTLEEYYDFDSDKYILIQDGIQRRFDEMRYGTLNEVYSRNPDLGLRAILWNMCAFPEFSETGGKPELKERFSGIDPNPLIVKYNSDCRKKEKKHLKSCLHEEVDDIVDFVHEVILHSRFYRDCKDELLKKSWRAFFPGVIPPPSFSIADYVDEIEEEIDSLSHSDVIDCRFPDSKLSSDTISYFIKESLITYFARLEYNSTINEVITSRTPYMVKKLYNKCGNSATDLERVVSQVFVAHDWLRDEKENWLNSDDRVVTIKGKKLNLKDYLIAGEQFLLFELVPNDITESSHLQNYFGKKKHFFGGKTFRVIPEDAEMKEGNDVQIADLGDTLEEYLKRSPSEYMIYAAQIRNELDMYRKKRPTMFVRKDRGIYNPATI